MKFIDIQQQYQRYRSDIDARMHQVLEAAQFIMGPEVQELEGTDVMDFHWIIWKL